jgi:hypothetical protein
MALFRVIAQLVLDPVDPCAQISAFGDFRRLAGDGQGSV